MKLVLAIVSSLLFTSLGMSAPFPGLGGLAGPRIPGPPIPGGGVTDPVPGGGFGPAGSPIPIAPIGGVTDPRGQAFLKVTVPIPTKICTTVTKTVCEGTGSARTCQSATTEKCIEVKFLSPESGFAIPSDATQVKVFDGIGKWSIYNNRGVLQNIRLGGRNLFNSN
ncbi:MAG TPA: hypothetical protein VE954_35165 [Oligoflexus sp.]|uniref:hypothetical protein n=1 Tax=Oligoflexus sp. TaxID=1971216 RepID=UPI002D5266F3|nr:hypothetical protein [Oligoflexus sp.]HYX38373.1 hypothetical protein [Oligoflexus sp.]